ncbi:MAG: glycosyltransferase [Tepidisphaeraceae bacterium]
MPLENYIGWAYLLAGPGVWGVFLFGMIKWRDRLRLLRRPIQPLPDPPPRVSVLVPIKDEEKQIDKCLASVLGQDYPDVQFIAINDRSVDRTGEILDGLSLRDSRIRVVHIREGELPPEWVGKSHALHVGMKHADGQWVLFVDSDVELTPDALSATIGLAEYKRFDLVSLLPRLITESFWERLIVPLGGMVTSAMFMLPMTNMNEWPGVAFANGQYLCVRRSAYEAIGGHEAAKETLSEDIAIAKALKKASYRPRLSDGTDFAATRMYSSLPMIMRGWARNFFCGGAGNPLRTVVAMLFILLACFSAYAALGWGVYCGIHSVDSWQGRGWMITGVIHLLIMTTALAINYRWTGNPIRYAMLFPLGGGIMLAIMTRTVWMCLTGRVEWRATRYTHKMGQGLVSPTQ